MAERRMFAKSIIDSDAFLDMPISARLLYYDLSMRADDDGFVNSPKKIMKFVGATNDDMNILIARKFVIAFENGVVVIKHWRIHNYIQSDRYKETNYKELKSQLELDENKAYRMLENKQCIQDVYNLDTQNSIGKVSIDKNNKENNKKKNFVKPTIDEIEAYIKENNLNVNPQNFYDYYESNGWMVGHNHMKSYQATLRRWSRTNKEDVRPSWLNTDITKEEPTKEELEELDGLLEEFK